MKLSKRDAEDARGRALAYEANMAIEGLELSAEGRALADRMDAEGVGYQEGVELVRADLKRRGLIPDRLDEVDFAAE